MASNKVNEPRRRVIEGNSVIQIATARENGSSVRLAKARCRLDEGVEHGLQIEGRSADNLEHVGGRLQLL
jgi:hypothetical protein